MKGKVVWLMLSAAMVCAIVSADVVEGADSVSVVVVAPKTLYTNARSSVTVTAVSAADREPVSAAVVIRFAENASTSTQVFSGLTDVSKGGRVTAEFDTPDVAPGAYSLEVAVDGLENVLTAQVQVRQMPILFVETDKPIYKPGQTIKARVLSLNNELRPAGDQQVEVEISDGKGVKIFRNVVATNSFGVGPFELPLASELNFGTWKITAELGSASTAMDVRVEKYVLPRFDVEVVTERDYFLVDETISGTVNANYFFGKNVAGTVEISASRYVGVWEEYATYSGTLVDGKVDFTLPAVGYVSGTSGTGGAGSAQLDVTVTDTSGHEEETNKLLKIVSSKLEHQLISSAKSITPGRPFEVMLVAETPDGASATASAEVTCEYYDRTGGGSSSETRTIESFTGSTRVTFTPPEDTSWVWVRSVANSDDATAEAQLNIYSSYSPSDSFIYLSRSSDEPVRVGGISGSIFGIDVFKTHDVTVYYDIFANGRTVWSGYTRTSRIALLAIPEMIPSAKVVAYIINPNNEISADSLQFDVILENAAGLEVGFNAAQVLPGDPVQVSVAAQTEAMVGLAIVDESVYALNEGRLNMEEVFKELERRFMEPQSETHQDQWEYGYGARDVFEKAGVQVLVSDNINLPQGQSWWPEWRGGWDDMDGWWGPEANAGPPGDKTGGEEDPGLAEVTRVRQFFPETWLWMPELMTDADGAASVDLTAPDSITTWRLHAVSTSQEGLGISESSLLVFQEFFGEPDLPYSVTRGEHFPVRIQVFNYLDTPQQVYVELAPADWFRLLEDYSVQQVEVGANSVGLASFLIEPVRLGRNMLDVTVRSVERADAVRKELLVEPEGTQRELVRNGLIRAGETVTLDTAMPEYRVAGSEKVLLSVTPSLVAQTMEGIDDLLGMPYGCGEQNMIFFAPDVEVLRYLDATGQLTPEVRAKAEEFITCGYQRELTYQRGDGSFSAFGESDDSGSLWLTAFVLGTFSAARDVQTIDETVLAGAAGWITDHQLADGSWEPIGFLHHQDMLGGLAGNYALTAYVAIALTDYGAASAESLNKAMQYLSNNLTTVNDDAYALAIAALAFVRTDNAAADAALARLVELAISDGDGIHWEPYGVETTAYVALAMMESEMAQANESIKWLSLQRNSLGGYGGSTQDTVMALKALMTAARLQSRNVNLTVTATSAGDDYAQGQILAEFAVNADNFDVLQIAEIGAAGQITLSAVGSGETRFQLVRRFNVMLRDEIVERDMGIEVTYDASHVEVDDIVNVNVVVRYFGVMESTGMMIVDVGVPTGFATVGESLASLVDGGLVSRVEVAGRKVILYVDGLSSGETREFNFQVKARFPVRAVIPDSKAYLYYDPGIRAEAAGRNITVGLDAACVGDLNGDDQRDLEDLMLVAGLLIDHGGPAFICFCADVNPRADLNGDGQTDLDDLQALASILLDVGTPFIVPCE